MKKYKIKQKIYNEIVNSKIARFALLGYKDQKGRTCSKELLSLLSKYQLKDMEEYYDVNIDEISKLTEVIFECDGYKSIRCTFIGPMLNYEKGYMRKVKTISYDLQTITNKNNENKDVIDKSNQSSNNLNRILIDKFFYTNQKITNKNNLLQIRLNGNIHEIIKYIDLTKIKYIENSEAHLFSIKDIALKQTIDNDYIIKILINTKYVNVIHEGYINTVINTNLSDVNLEIMQHSLSPDFIDLSNINTKDSKKIRNDNKNNNKDDLQNNFGVLLEKTQENTIHNNIIIDVLNEKKYLPNYIYSKYYLPLYLNTNETIELNKNLTIFFEIKEKHIKLLSNVTHILCITKNYHNVYFSSYNLL